MLNSEPSKKIVSLRKNDERFLQSQLVGLIFMMFPAAVPLCARGKRSVLIEQGSVSI